MGVDVQLYINMKRKPAAGGKFLGVVMYFLWKTLFDQISIGFPPKSIVKSQNFPPAAGFHLDASACLTSAPSLLINQGVGCLMISRVVYCNFMLS